MAELCRLHSAVPFQAFVIRLESGREVPVDLPQMLAYSPSGGIATVYLRNGTFTMISLQEIVALEIRDTRKNDKRSRERGDRGRCET